jgi:GDPmannose 4,6-dehydratase
MNFDGTSLVTGALGQDGFILCQRLQALGVQDLGERGYRAKVIAVARPGGQQTVRRDALIKLGCRVIELDVGNAAALAELVAAERPKHIFHLAAAHHSSDAGPETPEIWQSMTAINVAATEALASAAIRAGTGGSLIYASSSQIWTARQLEHRVEETTPVEPATFYGRTKIATADLLHKHRNRHGLRASVAILFNHESSLRSPNFVTRKVTMAAARAARGETKKLRLLNLGACVDWQAASDVAEGLLLMAKSEAPDDYVLASGNGRSVREFVEIAYRHVGLDWQRFVVAERDEPGPFLVGTPDKAARQLGWRPRQTFEGLIGSMVNADVARLRGEILP